MPSNTDEDDNIESVPHLPRPTPLPPEASKMGLSRSTEEGAILELAGALNPRKTSHRLVAWVLLAAISLPVLYTIVVEIF